MKDIRGYAGNKFKEDTATHEMTVLLDNGVYRHLRFKRPGTTAYYFDIVTFPGRLVISGDMGTYVFARLTDMFEFFRPGEQRMLAEDRINPGYWAEKCVAPDKNGVIKEFDSEAFEKEVLECFNEFFAEHNWGDMGPDQVEEIRTELLEELKRGAFYHASNKNPTSAIEALTDLSFREVDPSKARGGIFTLGQALGKEVHLFHDPWEWAHTTSYTFHYLWVLHAIVWGIQKYDEFKAKGATKGDPA